MESRVIGLLRDEVRDLDSSLNSAFERRFPGLVDIDEGLFEFRGIEGIGMQCLYGGIVFAVVFCDLSVQAIWV